MEETQVIIVGAGPSGLALALALAKFRVYSVVLEKEREITADPRGVYLTGDAVRILHSLGIGDDLRDIGQEVHEVKFHRSSFSSIPYHVLRIGTANAMQQVVPEGMLQSQPRLEYALRREIQLSEYCTLRAGCTVVSRSNDDPPTIEYIDEACLQHQIRGQWLIGADGKVGIVRKHFLEQTAGIKQELGVYEYDGTWVAANLQISLPTAETHPDFPLWDLGFSPEDVYDLFWPKGWHFCCPPGKPTASGRFGPVEARLWRHEFRQDVLDNENDYEALLWEHITPMIALDCGLNRKFPRPVQYPADCVQVLRCRPFRFTHKVVNRWFHERTVLIGDAAHVFPPFAGQGIASGVRDAHQLAWRLALILGNVASKEVRQTFSESILTAWALERRKSVNDAALFSKLNGWMCNHYPPLWFRMLLWAQTMAKSISFLSIFRDPQGQKEWEGFTSVEGGFFLSQYRGGSRLAQILVQSGLGEASILSDNLLLKSNSILTILVLANSEDYSTLYGDAKAAVAATAIRQDVLSEDSVIVYITPSGDLNHPPQDANCYEDDIRIFTAAPPARRLDQPSCIYDPSAYVNRLGHATKFAIVRPDFYVFACAKNTTELVICLRQLQGYLETGTRPNS